MLHKNIVLTTSNKKKLEEFKRFGLSFDVSEGMDLKEIKSNINNVIVHKALDAGVSKLVEDTVLVIDNEEIVDIRWKIEELKQMKNPNISWITSLAVLDEDGFVYVYRGEIKCKLVDNIDTLVIPEDAFGFDPYLCPISHDRNVNSSFYDLNKVNLKDAYSPRKMAVKSLIKGDFLIRIDSKQVPKWTGEYQHD